MLTPDLRPLTVGEIIDVALKIWRRQLPTLARIVVVVVAPLQILAALVTASVITGDSSFTRIDPATGTTSVDTHGLGGFIAGSLTAALLSGLAFLISSAAVLRAVSTAYLGGTPDWRESVRLATRHLGSLIWLAVLLMVGLFAAVFAFFIPSVWLGVSWSLAFPVLVAEGKRGTEALGRSFRLVKGRWWPTLGALALALLLQGIGGAIIGFPLRILAFMWEPNSVAGLLASAGANIVTSVITTPFVAAVLVLIYVDLRVRKEGFDLELLARGVGVTPPPPPPPTQWSPPPWPPPRWVPPPPPSEPPYEP